ncbi:MAG: hypothetical protein AAF572_08480 [Cyanobacteria bacterium P01_B01_bin.77]
MLLKLFRSTDALWKILLGSVVAMSLAPAVQAQQVNQSDVTGPNLSDMTGPNLSDVTGSNPSDNIGILGEEIFRTINGDFVTFSEFFEDFLNTYAEEFGLLPDDSLAEKLRKVSQACSSEDVEGGTRRFARTPAPGGSGIQPPSVACAQFNQLVQSARRSIADYRQVRNGTNAVKRRIW